MTPVAINTSRDHGVESSGRVTNSQTLEVKLRIITSSISLSDFNGKSWHVVTAITLRGDEQWILSHFRESIHERLNKPVVILGSLSIIVFKVVVVVRVGETDTAWLLNEDHVGNGVPGVWVKL